jgi:hypothetical protein
MATSTVADPSQPWVGRNVTVASDPAGTATTSASVCAVATEGATTSSSADENVATRSARMEELTKKEVARRRRPVPGSSAIRLRGSRSG